MAGPVKFVDLQSQYARSKAAIDEAIQELIASGAFILGPQVAELERLLAGYAGVRHCVGCASGTDALVLALRALGVGPGDEVITTPFSWFATAEVISRVGATPVFADIEADTYCLDPARVAGAITAKTRAIIPVSLYGQLCDMEALEALAEQHDLHLIEDGAQSFGAARNGRRSGAFGKIGCTSFYPTKVFSCYGDGGALFTDDDDLAERCRQMRIHGQQAPQEHVCIGMNSRLDSLQAAIMVAKFPHFADELVARQTAAERYAAALADLVAVPVVAPGNEHVYGVYTLRHPQRDHVVEQLRDAGLPVAIYYPRCIHQQPVYADLGYGTGSFPVAEQASREVFSLPMHPFLDAEAVEQVSGAVRQALGAS